MGAYLCIARNEVPPAVSKRVNLKVNCEYLTMFYSTLLLTMSKLRLESIDKRKTLFIQFNVYFLDKQRRCIFMILLRYDKKCDRKLKKNITLFILLIKI